MLYPLQVSAIRVRLYMYIYTFYRVLY